MLCRRNLGGCATHRRRTPTWVRLFRRWDEVVWEPNVAYSAVELSGPSADANPGEVVAYTHPGTETRAG